jgi:quinol monooxygenase YgiN
MSKLRLIFRLRIHPGQLAALKAVAGRILTIVEQRGPDTLEYEWFLSGDQTECVVLETFASSEALLEHAEMVAEEAQELFSICDLADIWLCGKPSRAVIEKTAAFAPQVYEFLQGRRI